MIRPIEASYSADSENMSSFGKGRTLFAALLNCITFGTVARRKLEAELREEERKCREHQAAQFEALKKRMQVEDEFNTLRYSDLPHVRQIGLLATPRDQRFEPR